MTFKILLFTMLPILCIAQVSHKEDILSNNNPSIERENLATKRNVMYNLEEIKVRWKKAALDNCTGVPCVVAPSFTCGTSTVSDIDGNAYNTVSIGTQCWTKENLKVTKYNDGTLIPDFTIGTWSTATFGVRTEYVGVAGYVGTYGYLYNWYAVSDSKKLCPTGWHVPTDAEWTNLIQIYEPTASASVVGPQSNTAGTLMKSTVTNPSIGSGLGWNPGSPGTNTSGFSALPGGDCNPPGTFNNIGNNALFWSVTENSFNAWCRLLSSSIGNVSRIDYNKKQGGNVRCLRD
jgi:uncharacterized protein (TIGR02145 family)